MLIKEEHTPFQLIIIGGGPAGLTAGLYAKKFGIDVLLIEKLEGRARKAGLDIVHGKAEGIERSGSLFKVTTEEHVYTARTLIIATGRTSLNSDMVKGLVKLDESGAIITDEKLATNVPGIFAAGDVRNKTLRQAVTPAADGAIAASSVKEFLLTP